MCKLSISCIVVPLEVLPIFPLVIDSVAKDPATIAYIFHEYNKSLHVFNPT